MILTPEENEEVVGILQQNELDIREEIASPDLKYHGDRMRIKWTEEMEVKAARLRELWKKMQLS